MEIDIEDNIKQIFVEDQTILPLFYLSNEIIQILFTLSLKGVIDNLKTHPWAMKILELTTLDTLSSKVFGLI